MNKDNDPFKGCIIKTYKPIHFEYKGFKIDFRIIPGWEYMIEFEALFPNEHNFFYVIYNIDNGYNNPQKKLKELLKCFDNPKKYFEYIDLTNESIQLEFDFMKEDYL